jgi:hypothetical protein
MATQFTTPVDKLNTWPPQTAVSSRMSSWPANHFVFGLPSCTLFYASGAVAVQRVRSFRISKGSSFHFRGCLLKRRRATMIVSLTGGGYNRRSGCEPRLCNFSTLWVCASQHDRTAKREPSSAPWWCEYTYGPAQAGSTPAPFILLIPDGTKTYLGSRFSCETCSCRLIHVK